MKIIAPDLSTFSCELKNKNKKRIISFRLYFVEFINVIKTNNVKLLLELLEFQSTV